MSLPPNEGKCTMAHSCVVGGRKWLLYQLDYDTADGPFATYFYAISDEHAAAIIEEIKSTARLGGQIIGTYPA